MKNRGNGVIDLTDDPLFAGLHLEQADRKHLVSLLENRLLKGNEVLSRLNLGKFALSLKPNFEEQLTGSLAIPFLLENKDDNICADWQWDAVGRIAQETFERKPSITGFYCHGKPKVGKTRVALTGSVLVAAMHELIYKQKSLTQFLLLPDKKHEISYTKKDFPLVRYLFDKFQLHCQNPDGTVSVVDIEEMINRWERVAHQLGGGVFQRRTSAQSLYSHFARQMAYAQAYNQRLFVNVDEADEGAGEKSTLDKLFGLEVCNGQTYKNIYQSDGQNAFALHYHWTATGKHLEAHGDRVCMIEIGSSPTYGGVDDCDLWDLEAAIGKLNMPSLRGLGVGTMDSNNPRSIRGFLINFYPDVVGKRDKNGDLIFDDHTGLVKPSKAALEEALSEGDYWYEWNQHKADTPKILAEFLGKLTKREKHVMWAHLRNNEHQLDLVQDIRKISNKFLIVPFLDKTDPHYGINWFKECKNSFDAVKKIRELSGSDLPVVITGTACFDRSNEFPRGIMADTATPAYSTETAYEQKAGRNAGSVEAQTVTKLRDKNKQPLIILLGWGAGQQGNNFKEFSSVEHGTTKSVHTVPKQDRPGVKIDLLRAKTEQFSIIKKAWEDTRRYYLNKPLMLTKKGDSDVIQDEGRLMGGGVLLTRLHLLGELNKDLFDIWNPALDWIEENHEKVLLDSLGRPLFAEKPKFQRLLNEKGVKAEQHKELVDGSTTPRPKKVAEAVAYKDYIRPYLDLDAIEETLGVNVHDGKAYVQIGLRATPNDDKLADRTTSNRNLQIQLFYRMIPYDSLPMLPVSIGFRLKNGPARRRNAQPPKDRNVGAKLLSEEERNRLGVSV